MPGALGDVIRRGADNVLANWPLLLIRIAESVAMIVITLGILIGAVVPIVAASVGGSLTDLFDGTMDPERVLRSISPFLILYVILVFSVVMLVAVVVHSFVQGGIVGCYLAGERAAPPGAARVDFRVFTPELWWSEGKRNVWRFFWIYNVIWGAWSLVLLLPLLPLILLLVAMPENPAAIVLAIVGFIAILVFAVALAFVAFVWSQVVLLDAAKRSLAPVEAISRSSEAMRGRVGNIILIGGIFFALSMLVGSGVAGFSFFFEAAGMLPGLGVALIPFQVILSLVNSAVSTLFGSWMIAALAAALHQPTPEDLHAVARA
ncbi:MAG TPA: hypothetical protein VLV48_02540 [Thermoanaerobaculia bacterium]|nr:hypothetical protein [Thermoanaerobaculia bacterium]